MRESEPLTYPVNLRLAGLAVLVVGAGRVGLRKIRGLVEAGARVTVIAPVGEPEVARLAAEGRIVWHRRAYDGDVSPAFRLVFVATADDGLNRRVAADAGRDGLFVNVADVPELCSFYLPARVRRGRLQLAVNSDGSAPFASRRLRQRLEVWFGEEYADWADAAAAFRAAVLAEVADPRRRDELFDRFFAETVPAAPAEGGGPRVPAEDDWRGWIAASRGDAGVARPQPDRPAGGDRQEDPDA